MLFPHHAWVHFSCIFPTLSGGSEDLSKHSCFCRADGRQLWALAATQCHRSWCGGQSFVCNISEGRGLGISIGPLALAMRRSLRIADTHREWMRMGCSHLQTSIDHDWPISIKSNSYMSCNVRSSSGREVSRTILSINPISQQRYIGENMKVSSHSSASKFTSNDIKWLVWFVWPLFILILGWWLHKGSQGWHLWDLVATNWARVLRNVCFRCLRWTWSLPQHEILCHTKLC